MQTKVIHDIKEIPAADWNALLHDSNPFLRHEFLSALESHYCVNPQIGWQPSHITLYEDNKLIAASPAYVKGHSQGEFVFDWSWAEAYERHDLNYYPKLIVAIPFTPLTGQRLLISDQTNFIAVAEKLISATIETAKSLNCSSSHWLFPNEIEKTALQQQKLSIRLGCQYHWENDDYTDFNHFLNHLSSRKRKNIIKERRQVYEAGVTFRVLHGHEISENEWRIFHQYYCAIYDRKWGAPSLTLAFFREIGQTLAENLVLILAYQHGECIAAALNLRSDDTLYGRHWGCRDYLPALHFETCYYQGLEYCIQHNLKRYEPGAQGEHKIARGFLPTPTWSAHWIAHPDFADAIEEFCCEEQKQMQITIEKLTSHSPYKRSDS